jgi:hypothetical protein
MTIHDPEFPYEYHKKVGNVIRGGTLQIPFDCDAPEDATFLFACDKSDLPESTASNVKVCEIFNSNIGSKFAYFRIKS